MLNKEEIENSRIPKQLAKALGIEKEDDDSLIAFKENIFEQTVRENIKLKKQVEQLESDNYEANKRIDEYIEERKKIIESLKEIRNNLNKDGFIGYADDLTDILHFIIGEEN